MTPRRGVHLDANAVRLFLRSDCDILRETYTALSESVGLMSERLRKFVPGPNRSQGWACIAHCSCTYVKTRIY